MSLPDRYDFATAEPEIYRAWLEAGCFSADPDQSSRVGGAREPFTIVMPPPNVTAILHVGHGLNSTVQDVIIRWARMKGTEALWLPGTDHAGIATQNVVEKLVAAEGKTRFDLGREAFVRRTEEFVSETGGVILQQLRGIGASADWSRTAYTLSPELSLAVREAFVRLYDRGLIYRGYRVIHWCPRCLTSLSDEEAEFNDETGKLYHIAYPVEGQPGRSLVIATTRPETMLADVAVAVNPDDERYRDLVGKSVRLPVVERAIPVIADAYADPAFGTGVVKITPAHDANDFEVGRRHSLAMPIVIDEHGIVREVKDAEGRVPPAIAGLDRFDAREQIVELLRQSGALQKVETHQHAVRHCYRCDTVVEPRLSDQWFVKMEPLARPALQAVRDGAIRILPERWEAVYVNWLTNIRDWNISRQLWWGHRIPVWYRGEEMVVSLDKPEGEGWTQDEDVLDTWFSSWLWPFATLGWPEKTPDLERYYPNSLMVTGSDIIFFWVARMMMAGCHFMGVAPFHTIYLHGMVRDKLGRKMSKSLGNGIDPIEVIDQYGSDALRFTLLTTSTPGNDTKLDVSRIAGNRNFANKIWNAARFVIGQTEGAGGGIPAPEALQPKTLADRWIVSRLTRLIGDTTRLMEEYQFGEAGRQLFEFFWSEYCDWYLEAAKRQLQDERLRENTARILRSALDTALRLLHPFMPFLTEEVWQHLWAEEPASEWPATALIVASWPGLDAEATARLTNETAEEEFALLEEIITRIRDARKQINDVRQEQRQPKLPRVRVILAGGKRTPLLKREAALIEQLAATEPPQIERKLATKPEQAMSMVASGVEIYIPVADLFDIEREIARIDEQIKAAQAALARTQGMLANEQFVTRAKPEVVQKERDALAAGEDTLARLAAQRRDLAG